jgi:TrmH family RNA methyltransferase
MDQNPAPLFYEYMMPVYDSYKLKPLKWYKSLADLKGRLEAQCFAIEGERAIRQIVISHPEAVLEIVTVEKPADVYEKFPVRMVSESQFRTITSAITPQGILAVVRMPKNVYTSRMPEKPGERVLLLEDVQDPGNIGTLVRTAAAFNYSGVILSQKCADQFSLKCIQSTAGSILELWSRRTPDYLVLVKSLLQNEYTLIAADLNGQAQAEDIHGVKNLILALGSEANGLSQGVLELAKHRVKIPIIRDKAESLNVAASGAILMYLSTEQN